MGKRPILIKFMIFFVLFFIYQLLYVYYHGSYAAININTMIFNTFKGCDFIEVGAKFDLPLLWLFINSYIIYAVGDYFYEDIKVNEKYVLIRSKNMGQIYIAKIVWSILMIFIYYGVLILITSVVGSIFSREATRYIDKEYLKVDTLILIKNVFIMYTLTSISLVVIFITLTLCLKPTYSFIVDIVICLLSVFSSSNLFLGQHSLLLRHVPFNTFHNLTLNYSIIYNLVLFIIVITIGYTLSSKKDVF